MKTGRVVLLVVGVLVLLAASGLLFGGGALVVLDAAFTDEDGYLTAPEIDVDRPGYAVLSETARLEWGAAWRRWPRATVRIRAAAVSDGVGVFLGIGPIDRVEAYLAGVPHDVVDELSVYPVQISYRSIAGNDGPEPPTAQEFWGASVAGLDEQTLRWEVTPEAWVLVVMNADGAPRVRASLTFGLQLPWLGQVGVGLLVAGALVLLAGVAAVVFALRGRPALSPEAPQQPIGDYPLTLTGELSEPLSPALWLVKWFLLIPHYVVLGFLWAGFCVSWFLCLVAIVCTGRYPRALFDYNVGVLRWSWRVGFYSYQALGTDRYPPFSLRAGGYRADLDVAYPERLSRGLALVKWWLLAVPQLMIVGLFQGGGGQHWGGGLVPLLTLYAGVVLLFTGRYPRDMFSFIMGMNRWTYRVLAYVALMTDRYPPFRLED